MVRKIILTIFLIMMFAHTVSSEEIVKYENLTGGKTKDKIVINSKVEGSRIWYTVDVFRKTANGWEKISNDNFPFQTINAKTKQVYPVKVIWSDKGGLVIDEFDSRYGKEILIYLPDQVFHEEVIFLGFFFRYDKNKKQMVLRGKNITDHAYKFAYLDNNKKLFDPREKIIKEFKGKTNFAKAYEVVVKFWNAIKKQDWDTAYSLCEPEVKTTVEAWKTNFNDQNIQNSLSIQFYSWNGKFDENNKTYDFSGINDKMWQNIGVNQNFKIKIFIGDGRNVGI